MNTEQQKKDDQYEATGYVVAAISLLGLLVSLIAQSFPGVIVTVIVFYASIEFARSYTKAKRYKRQVCEYNKSKQ